MLVLGACVLFCAGNGLGVVVGTIVVLFHDVRVLKREKSTDRDTSSESVVVFVWILSARWLRYEVNAVLKHSVRVVLVQHLLCCGVDQSLSVCGFQSSHCSQPVTDLDFDSDSGPEGKVC